jgi:hypothetical protein
VISDTQASKLVRQPPSAKNQTTKSNYKEASPYLESRAMPLEESEIGAPPRSLIERQQEF